MPLPPLENPSPSENLAGLARIAPAMVFLGSTLVILNAGQTLSLVIKPFSLQTFRRLNRWVADTWWGWCVQAARLVHGTRIEVTGDEVPVGENAVVVTNHQQMADITFLMFYARSKHRLGDMKWFAKDSIKYVPVLGWAMVLIDSVFVKRDWTADRASIAATFASFIRDRVPMWLVSFPEGTRVGPDKIESSRRYAREHGLAPLTHLLLPRTKGFVASVQGLRSHVDAVYDITIGYERGVPSLWQYVKGLSRVAHLHVRRFEMSRMPVSDDDLAAWLNARFEEKDRLLDHFYEHGAFAAT